MGFDAVDGMGVALVDKPGGAGRIDKVGITGDAVVLSLTIALTIVGATDDDGMSDVTTDKVDQYLLTMTQRMGLPHVLGNEVTGHGDPVRAVLALLSVAFFALPVVADMSAVVTVASNGATIVVNNTSTHQTRKTRVRLP